MARKQQPVAAMFPGGDDTPLISGTAMRAPEAARDPEDDRPERIGVDPSLGDDQTVMTLGELDAFAPAAIAGRLSSGTWSVVEGRALIGGYAYQVKTTSPRGPIYPVALAVTPADAAVLAQAKRLLQLVVRAFAVPADTIADPDWQAWLADAKQVMIDCAQSPPKE